MACPTLSVSLVSGAVVASCPVSGTVGTGGGAVLDSGSSSGTVDLRLPWRKRRAPNEAERSRVLSDLRAKAEWRRNRQPDGEARAERGNARFSSTLPTLTEPFLGRVRDASLPLVVYRSRLRPTPSSKA